MQKLLLVVFVLASAAAAVGLAPTGKLAPGLYVGQVLDSVRSGKYDFRSIPVVYHDTAMGAEEEYYKAFSWVGFRPVGRVKACPDSSCIVVRRGTNGAYFLGNVPARFGKLEAFVFPYKGFTVFHFMSFTGTTVTNYFVFDHRQRTYYNFHYGSTSFDSVELQARWPLRNIMELDSNLRVRQRIGLDSGEVWFRSSFRYNYRGRPVEEEVAFISRARGSAPSFRTDRASLGELFGQPPPPGHESRLLKLDLPPFFMRSRIPIWACDLRLFHDMNEKSFNGYSRDNRTEDWP
jgi:hypothetical protein